MDWKWVVDTSPWIHSDMIVWNDLIKEQTPVFYKKNSFLFHEGDSPSYVYIVVSGRIRITYYHIDGMEKQLYIAEHGCICGENCCISKSPHTNTALAIVDTTVYKIPTAKLIERMKQNWNLNQMVFCSICRKNTIYQNQIIELSFSQAIQRITQIMLNLNRQYGTPVPEGSKIDLRFTHSEVASLINTSRVTVSNIINMMIEQGYLAKKDNYFIIPDLPFLEELAEGRRELT